VLHITYYSRLRFINMTSRHPRIVVNWGHKFDVLITERSVYQVYFVSHLYFSQFTVSNLVLLRIVIY